MAFKNYKKIEKEKKNKNEENIKINKKINFI